MPNPFKVVRDFEAALSEYTGAPFVVAVNSGTSSLHLAMEWYKLSGGTEIMVPSRTYRSVPIHAERAGLDIWWNDNPWQGVYHMKPSNIWDCALRLTGGMYSAGQVQCVSFHPQKNLALDCGGGAILHDDPEADVWYRLARFDGRTEGMDIRVDSLKVKGWHYYMWPSQAAAGIQKLSILPRHMPDKPQPEYEDVRSKW